MIVKSMPNLVLAGDIGGTKALIGAFEPAPVRPRRRFARAYGTHDHPELPAIIETFMRDAGITRETIGAACFGVAGPVIDEAADLTNVPWRIDAREITRAFGFPGVRLLNDLVAMAYSVPVLEPSELHVLQTGVANSTGNLS